MLRGLTTVNFIADDMTAAKRWYTELLGLEPYFDRAGPDGTPAYLEFRIGDYAHEFGIMDRRYAPHRSGKPDGAIVYWHVDDINGAVDRLLALGATAYEPVTERGPGFVTAAVVDPFGIILGVMFNQHYLEVLGL